MAEVAKDHIVVSVEHINMNSISDYFFVVIVVQSSSAYVLFYQRRTEGRPVNILDRSLSQSFAEERKILSNKYKGAPDSTVEELVAEPEGDDVSHCSFLIFVSMCLMYRNQSTAMILTAVMFSEKIMTQN